VFLVDFLVIPMFSIWVKFLDIDESVCPLMSQLKTNKEHWKTQLDLISSKTAAAAGEATTTHPIPRDVEAAREGGTLAKHHSDSKKDAQPSIALPPPAPKRTEDRKEQHDAALPASHSPPRFGGNRVAPSPIQV
jgi:hypothetical protein